MKGIKLEKLKIEKSRVLLGVEIFVGLILLLLFHSFLIKKPKAKIEAMSREIKKIEAELNKKKAMQKEVKNYEDKRKLEIEAKALKFRELIPLHIDSTDIVEMIEALSTKYDLRETKIDFTPVEEVNESLHTREFKVLFQGKYENILKFLQALQKENYIINIKEVEINRNEEIVPFLEAKVVFSVPQTAPSEEGEE
jgi:Tfp pilus assembly protein PilO